jgi:dTDP-4-dehydrorhamnose 3,5-epimerase
VIDARARSTTFGSWVSVVLDDTTFKHLYVPPGFLHGYQVMSDVADVCYRIDRVHQPVEDLAVHFADPDLAIAWPAPPSIVSTRDQAAGSWSAIVSLLRDANF